MSMTSESVTLMEATSAIWTAASIVLGGLITWLASRHYYLRAGADLRNEAAELRRMNTLVLRALEEGRVVEFTKDAIGNPIGLRIELSGRA